MHTPFRRERTLYALRDHTMEERKNVISRQPPDPAKSSPHRTTFHMTPQPQPSARTQELGLQKRQIHCMIR